MQTLKPVDLGLIALLTSCVTLGTFLTPMSLGFYFCNMGILMLIAMFRRLREIIYLKHLTLLAHSGDSINKSCCNSSLSSSFSEELIYCPWGVECWCFQERVCWQSRDLCHLPGLDTIYLKQLLHFYFSEQTDSVPPEDFNFFPNK